MFCASYYCLLPDPTFQILPLLNFYELGILPNLELISDSVNPLKTR
jgi:hypothetical protein